MTPTEISIILEYGTKPSVTRRHEPENRDHKCTDFKTKNSHDIEAISFLYLSCDLRTNAGISLKSDHHHLTPHVAYSIIHYNPAFNPLTPNDLYISRTAPLTSKRCILYIYSTNIGTKYFKHALYSPFFFLFKMHSVS